MVRLSCRQIMKNLTDFFTSGGSKKQTMRSNSHSLRKNSKKKKSQQLQQQQEQQQRQQQQEQEQQQQIQQQWEQQPQEKKVEKDIEGNICAANTSIETPDQSSYCYTDSDDEVFLEDETCSLRAGESRGTSHGVRKDESVSGLTGCFPGSRRHSRTLPSIVVDEAPQHCQDRDLNSVKYRSESHCWMTQTRTAITATPTSQERHSEITFDESAKATSSGRKMNHFRRPRKGTFTVKYTKVYGEADGAYKNDSAPRGLVFVCNFSKFKNDVYTQRVGSDTDYDNMINLFQQLGYDPYHRRRRYCMTGFITKKDFMEKLGAFAREAKHNTLCSCVVILMSHGTGPKTFVTSDNQEVDLLDVYKIFDNINCGFLQGKPKIFILQFCRSREAAPCREKALSEQQQQINSDLVERLVKEQVRQIMRKYLRRCSFSKFIAEGGDKNQLFIQIEENSRQASLASLSSSIIDQEEEAKASGSTPLGDYQADTHQIPSIPQEGIQRYSDMYSIFSTSPGELSHRHPEKGSLLIQAICHVFAEYAYQDDIDTLVRRVSTYMSKTLQKDDPITVPRQTCERTNNGLDKMFYFNPYEMVQDRQFTI